MFFTWSRKSKASLILHWLPKYVYLKISLTRSKKYILDNYKRMQTVLLKYQIFMLQPDNDITKNRYERKNLLVQQIIK